MAAGHGTVEVCSRRIGNAVGAPCVAKKRYRLRTPAGLESSERALRPGVAETHARIAMLHGPAHGVAVQRVMGVHGKAAFFVCNVQILDVVPNVRLIRAAITRPCSSAIHR